VRLAITPFGSVWKIWNEWLKMTISFWIATCGSYSAWWGTWRASGAIAAGSPIR
jgi:hypothetical protein